TATITVIPESKPSSVTTEDLVHDIRDAGTGLKADTDAEILVTGATAMNIDVSEKLNDALVPYLILLVGLAFLLLIVVFRSILVPTMAALCFVLSEMVAWVFVVTLFQWRWLSGELGAVEMGSVMAMMPNFLFVVVIGLVIGDEMC